MTPEEEARATIRVEWAALRLLQQATGPQARMIRRAAYASLQAAYAGQAGASIGIGERLLLAGVVWNGADR